jgi:hypothetical protein
LLLVILSLAVQEVVLAYQSRLTNGPARTCVKLGTKEHVSRYLPEAATLMLMNFYSHDITQSGQIN